MNYQEVLHYLNRTDESVIHLGLENTRQILDRYPRFHRDFEVDAGKVRYIQVAGTNGKGSTAYILASILQAAGYRVGLFTSPHLEDIRERIIIDKQWISEEDFSHGVESVKGLAEDLLKGGNIMRMPTYFEYTFLTALYHFFREKVDAAVLEVGLGGRLDATSTLRPDVSVITTIGKDHTAVLGTRLRDIAREKAGIIKPGVPVVCGCGVKTIAHRVIKNLARQNQAPYYNVFDPGNRLDIRSDNHYYRCTYTTKPGEYRYEVRLNGIHQTVNAAVAVKTLQVANHHGTFSKVSPVSISEGIAQTFIPARIETLGSFPPVILDGSHNVQSITALTHFLEEKKKKHLTLVFGVLADKNYREMIPLLLPYTGEVILTEPLSHRALPAEKMLKYFKSKRVLIKKDPGEAYRAAQQFKREILITGSFYLVGAIRKQIFAGG